MATHNLSLDLVDPEDISLGIIPEGTRNPPPPPPPRPKPKHDTYQNFTKLWSLAIAGREGRKSNGKPIPGGWATEKGKTYTPKDSGCTPTLEEIKAIQKTGIKIYGKIVLRNNIVYNADADNKM